MRRTPDEHKDTQVIRVDPSFHKSLKTAASLEGKTMKEKSKEVAEDLQREIEEAMEGFDTDRDDESGVSFL